MRRRLSNGRPLIRRVFAEGLRKLAPTQSFRIFKGSSSEKGRSSGGRMQRSRCLSADCLTPAGYAPPGRYALLVPDVSIGPVLRTPVSALA